MTYREKVGDYNVPEQHVPVLWKRAIDDGRNLHLVSSLE